MKPFLILQLRPEDDASDSEFRAFLEKGDISQDRTVRVRLERDPLPANLSLDDFAGVVLGGGPGCVSDDPATRSPDEARAEAAILSLMPEISERDFPFMGCCAGIGILAHYLGGDVSKARFGEPVGPVECQVTNDGESDPLFTDLPSTFESFVGHKEALQELPPNSVHLMSSGPCPFQMIRHKSNVYATQFHPEADADVFAERIRIYKGHGYFEPEDAERLTKACYAANVTVPSEILRRFFVRFQ